MAKRAHAAHARRSTRAQKNTKWPMKGSHLKKSAISRQRT
ncbi:hypothetical protein BPC006_I2991 [Burkholderia pseudomallei BPC006]|nr:hypothetical protein BPC006_I2991 [Burkholderia pseudomallei BPC006]